jgi:hypothetical protein
MAVIHRTTLTPGKLELLSSWLPGQPWYQPAGRGPELVKAGGFRLDDPAGAVGIEFMVVTDGGGSGARAYQVPMTYRAGACADAAGALIGTARHGVLGERRVYDGLRDPVLVAQLVALLQGTAAAQAQGESHTPDPTVLSSPVPGGPLAVTGPAVISDEPGRTELTLTVTAGQAASSVAGWHGRGSPVGGHQAAADGAGGGPGRTAARRNR